MTTKPFAPPDGHQNPRELLAKMRAIEASIHARLDPAVAREKVIPALIDCLRSNGYGPACDLAEALMAPPEPGTPAAEAALDDGLRSIGNGAAEAAIAVESATVAENTEPQG